MDVMTNWRVQEGYSVYEVSIEHHTVIFKDWWDPGHDPNRLTENIKTFVGSRAADEIKYRMGEAIYNQVVVSINTLIALTENRK